MSTADNKAFIRRGIEVFNRGNPTEALATWDDIFAPDFVIHNPNFPGGFRRREDYLQVLSSLFTSFPGQFTIEDLIAEGEKVVFRFTYSGIHQGQWRGLPPTGKSVMFTGTITYCIVDGKAVEAWANEDILSLMQQLGLLPKQG